MCVPLEIGIWTPLEKVGPSHENVGPPLNPWKGMVFSDMKPLGPPLLTEKKKIVSMIRKYNNQTLSMLGLNPLTKVPGSAHEVYVKINP